MAVKGFWWMTAYLKFSTLCLIKEMEFYKESLLISAKNKQTQPLNTYLVKLASKFHEFYNDLNISSLLDENQKKGYLLLIKAVAIILKNGLSLLGVKAYEKM